MDAHAQCDALSARASALEGWNSGQREKKKVDLVDAYSFFLSSLMSTTCLGLSLAFCLASSWARWRACGAASRPRQSATGWRLRAQSPARTSADTCAIPVALGALTAQW